MDAGLAWHAHKLDMKLQLFRHGFSLFARKMLANLWGHIQLLSILHAMIGITSYCCVILKMVILHDAIKIIQNTF